MLDLTCSIVIHNHTFKDILPLINSINSSNLKIKIDIIDNSPNDNFINENTYIEVFE